MMKTLTKKQVLYDRKNKVMFFPRFGLILSIFMLALSLYFDLLFPHSVDTIGYIILILIAIASTIMIIFLNKRLNRGKRIAIFVDRIADKNIEHIGARRVVYYLHMEKAGTTRLERLREYVKSQIGDKCFVVYVEGMGGFLAYNCREYCLDDELNKIYRGDEFDGVVYW